TLELFSAPVSYALPRVTASHLRHFLSANSEDMTNKQKVFDAFICIDPAARVTLCVEADPSAAQVENLRLLLANLPYLGRSESWVDAVLLEGQPEGVEFNCRPISTEKHAENVTVATARSREEYTQVTPKIPVGAGKKTRDQTWLEALCTDTGTLITTNKKSGAYSGHPLLKTTPYTLPPMGVELATRAMHNSMSVQGHGHVKFALSSTVLPRITETVAIAERARRKLMGIHRKIMGSESLVSSTFSGKNPDGTPMSGHDHAFFWPVDEDNDGKIDHLIIRSGRGFDHSELRALNRFTSMWQSDGKPDLNCVLVELGRGDTRRSITFTSATPVTLNRHWRKGRGDFNAWLREEIEQECTRQGLPTPIAVEFSDGSPSAHKYKWIEFLRSRKGQTPKRGYGFKLTFGEPVSGPFALGSYAHFGLGLFMPLE
ncbi:type I-U CRISPR-associated protein Cas5/Cas6, partial [Myxococcota bacterium]|nr:type I-U CRISPR-associated protein Cas5/Cas6 [Myxococcota bacterium]